MVDSDSVPSFQSMLFRRAALAFAISIVVIGLLAFLECFFFYSEVAGYFRLAMRLCFGTVYTFITSVAIVAFRFVFYRKAGNFARMMWLTIFVGSSILLYRFLNYELRRLWEVLIPWELMILPIVHTIALPPRFVQRLTNWVCRRQQPDTGEEHSTRVSQPRFGENPYAPPNATDRQ